MTGQDGVEVSQHKLSFVGYVNSETDYWHTQKRCAGQVTDIVELALGVAMKNEYALCPNCAKKWATSQEDSA
jgi:hypothetical protein